MKSFATLKLGVNAEHTKNATTNVVTADKPSSAVSVRIWEFIERDNGSIQTSATIKPTIANDVAADRLQCVVIEAMSVQRP
jgi:hypothetical protein